MAKTIIIKDADYSANKVDTVAFGEQDPVFVCVGGFNARKATGGVYSENVTTGSGEGKYGVITANNTDTNVRTFDRNGGTNEGNFRLVPIMLPTGTKRITLKSKAYSGSTLIGFKTRFLWMDSTNSVSGYVGANCLDGKGSSSYDQDEFVTEYTAVVPSTAGIDSFGIALYMADYALVWNHDQAEKFEIEYLYTDA